MIYVCVCIYMFVCLWVLMHFLWWTPMVRRAALSWSWLLLTLWCGYALKATAVGVYSYYILCMIITVCLSRSMSASESVSLYMWHASTCLMLWWASTCPCMNMLTHFVYIGTNLGWCAIAHQTRNFTEFLPWKWGTFDVVFLQRKLSEDSVLCAITN